MRRPWESEDAVEQGGPANEGQRGIRLRCSHGAAGPGRRVAVAAAAAAMMLCTYGIAAVETTVGGSAAGALAVIISPCKYIAVLYG